MYKLDVMLHIGIWSRIVRFYEPTKKQQQQKNNLRIIVKNMYNANYEISFVVEQLIDRNYT